MQLGSRVVVAVVQASSCSSDLTSSLGTSVCHGCGPKKKKKMTLWKIETGVKWCWQPVGPRSSVTSTMTANDRRLSRRSEAAVSRMDRWAAYSLCALDPQV